MRAPLLVLITLLNASGLAAQSRTVSGQVQAAGEPVPNQPVSLHRVTEQGGTTVATDTTNAAGQFALTYVPEGGQGIHFVATRYREQLYIGETFREAPVVASYVVEVGPGATPINLGAAVRENAAAPSVDRRARSTALLIAGIILSLSAALILAATRFRSSPTRKLLVEIGDLDNRHLQQPVEGYETIRSDLLRRLRETA